MSRPGPLPPSATAPKSDRAMASFCAWRGARMACSAEVDGVVKRWWAKVVGCLDGAVADFATPRLLPACARQSRRHATA